MIGTKEEGFKTRFNQANMMIFHISMVTLQLLKILVTTIWKLIIVYAMEEAMDQWWNVLINHASINDIILNVLLYSRLQKVNGFVMNAKTMLINNVVDRNNKLSFISQ
jgi:hypothetical protein